MFGTDVSITRGRIRSQLQTLLAYRPKKSKKDGVLLHEQHGQAEVKLRAPVVDFTSSPAL